MPDVKLMCSVFLTCDLPFSQTSFSLHDRAGYRTSSKWMQGKGWLELTPDMWGKIIYTYIEERKKQRDLSSLQACFVITHSSGDFIVKNIRNHRLYTLRTCIIGVAVNFVQFLRSNALPLWLHEDTSSLRLLSDDNSGRQMIINFSLRQSLHLLLALL